MDRIKKRIIAILLVLCVCLNNFSLLSAQETTSSNSGTMQTAAAARTAGQVTVSIEKFTLGQGYYLEPVNVPFTEGECVGSVIARVLGSGHYNDGTDSDNISYVANIYDPNRGTVNVPSYILDKTGSIQEDNDDWLGSGDYSSTSGWMYIVNNQMASCGMSDYTCQDGDVIRLEFSVYGWGTDIGFGWNETIVTPADKDDLTRLIAVINGREDKETLLQQEAADQNGVIEDDYDAALSVLKNMESTQDEVDASYAKLSQDIASYNESDEEEQEEEENNSDISSDRSQDIETILSAISDLYSDLASGWAIMDMAAYGKKDALSQSDIDDYVADVKAMLPTATRATDFDKAALILTSLGIDARSVELQDGTTFDIIDRIATHDIGGINGAIFALLAYDSGNYTVEDKEWTRAKIIDYLKDEQQEDGGWTLRGSSDPDMTAMVLSALAPYYENGQYDVSECVDKGIQCLSDMQQEDGLFASYGTANASSAAMAVIALSSLGIDADTDSRFIKGDVSALDALLAFESPEHQFGYSSNASSSAFSTEQGFRALIAYQGYKESKAPYYIYQFGEITEEEEQPEEPIVSEEGETIQVAEETITISEDDNKKIYVVSESIEPVLVTTPAVLGITYKTTTMPALTVKKIDQDQTIELKIEEGAVITSSINWDGRIELPHRVANPVIAGEKVDYTIKIGNDEDLLLSKPARILLPQAKNKRVGYIGADGQFVEITNKLSKDKAEALAETQTEGKINVGNDLVIWTRHFTLFAVLDNVNDGHGSNESVGGNSSNDNTQKNITVSFKLIGDSKHSEGAHKQFETWISKTKYTVAEGSVVKDVFVKALKEAGISYISEGSYVSSINGLAEFDNGPNSGWMYIVNGLHPSVGCADYELSNNDEIIWHYSDDYTKGDESDEWSGNSSTGSNLTGTGATAAVDQVVDQAAVEETEKITEEAVEHTHDFEDVPQKHWASEYIYYLADRGIISGKDEKCFCPGDKITRAEFTAMLYRMSGEKTAEEAVCVFSDVKEKDWFKDAVVWAVNAGITKGISKDQFAPNAYITREQMAVMTAQFVKYMNVELALPDKAQTALKDEKAISDYARESVRMMQQAGIIQGRENACFAPKEGATRAEAAKMLTLVFRQINQ